MPTATLANSAFRAGSYFAVACCHAKSSASGDSVAAVGADDDGTGAACPGTRIAASNMPQDISNRFMVNLLRFAKTACAAKCINSDLHRVDDTAPQRTLQSENPGATPGSSRAARAQRRQDLILHRRVQTSRRSGVQHVRSR